MYRASLVAFCVLALAACGSEDAIERDESPLDESPSLPEDSADAGRTFEPEPPLEGYTRIPVPTMPDLPAGSDTMYCQYVYGPLDVDMDVLGVTGVQSVGGHHAVAYATSVIKPVGTSGPCDEEDGLAAGFLGGVGGEVSQNARLPEGVAFRLPAGNMIMLNTHFLNTTPDTIDGETVLDVAFVDVDPNRQIASLFANGNFSFQIGPQAAAEAVAECTLPHDMEFIMLANHMHDYGTHVWTDLVRGGSTEAELIREDPEWSYEMQFNAEVRSWSPDAPLALHAGDTLRTHCNWQNTTDEALVFPREMCIGFGYFLGDGSTSPVCFDGTFREAY